MNNSTHKCTTNANFQLAGGSGGNELIIFLESHLIIHYNKDGRGDYINLDYFHISPGFQFRWLPEENISNLREGLNKINCINGIFHGGGVYPIPLTYLIFPP